MELLTPSFQSNQFGLRDLNAVTLETSPGYTLQREHPSGKEYAQYLKQVAKHFELPIEEGVEVKEIVKKEDYFEIETSEEDIKSEFVVWAGGEYSRPRKNCFPGSEHCIHNIEPDSWEEFSKGKDQTFVIIGGYESGIDTAINLSKLGYGTVLIDKGEPWRNDHPDPSRSLSPRTSQRLFEEWENERITLLGDTEVEKVRKDGERYEVLLAEEDEITVSNRPILATGFEGTAIHLEHLFDIEDGSPAINGKDESVKTDNLLLVGPEVKHGDAIFCFIYKYRKRFPVVAEEIAQRLGMNVEDIVERYKEANMYLEDTEKCCEDICRC